MPFRRHVEKYLDALLDVPGGEVLVHGGRRITAARFCSLAYRTASALRLRGVGPRQGVTLLGGNLPELLAARYAAGLLGCRVSQLHTVPAAEVQSAIVRDVETSALIVDQRFAQRAGDIADMAGVG